MKKRKNRSIIWKINRVKLQTLVKKSNTFSDILKHFNLQNKGGNTNTLKRRLYYDKIDFSHIPTGRNSGRGLRRGGLEQISLDKILVKNSTYSRYSLKKRLIDKKIIPHICSECKFDPEKQVWQNQKLVLTLDHINGISNDNRKQNLRFLCPNCNSQTDTFCGRRRKYNSGSSNWQDMKPWTSRL